MTSLRLRSSVLACALVASIAVVVAGADRFSGRVVGVSDGDTISVMRDGRAVKIRLEGVDCPEKGQAYGNVAKLFTSDHVFGKQVEVVGTTIDRYGRIVGRVSVNGQDLSTALVTAGLAWHYTEYSSDRALDAAEQSARAARRGLWSQSNPTPPWVYRRHPSGSASASPFGANDSRRSTGPRSSRPFGAPRVNGPASNTTLATPSALRGAVHGNVRSHLFHAPGCPNYNCRNCTAVFATAEEAMRAGYKPAGDCAR